ncbi:N-acetylmuramoyl-L-alanine amidase [Catalinimonas niigatensis]|uniref:N-acetylmuramoyl-L-alanine amidase n=1 Tax=Catalinimonas niigatensis TaxID=1397264 RepID=UPI002665DAB7|nr:N-acetylmuramoyl-L-alanine amidase [Catalinimonas niigatensis]WPP48539.1 N-acetylmuramoyl-L-alanine amidase [Catalinimonas niigatensis]
MLSDTFFKRLWLVILQILCFCFSLSFAFAQNKQSLHTRQTSQNPPYYSRQQATVASDKHYAIQPDFSFTALSLTIDRSATFEGAYVIVGQDTFFLREDEHLAEEDPFKHSGLLIFDTPQTTFAFFSASIRGNVSFSLINAESGRGKANARMQESKKQRHSDQNVSCQPPEMIRTSVWREGLPEPAYNRIETNVRHVIVHHSAGSNISTDYLNTVRNIYLFHTQDRGWSDVGYNYLIAQDGTIFQGRSYSDDQADNDDVQGAHFCGQNSGTMGICMMGNFNTAVPSDTSITSLIRLTAWKLDKESLNPLASSSHPANSNLGVIAGHRNGCATECPGDNLYAMLEDIRLETEAYLEAGCQDEEEEPLAFQVYPIPTDGQLNISLPPEQIPEAIWLIDAAGNKFSVQAYLDQEEGIWMMETYGLATGVYILQISGDDFEQTRKLLIH